MVDVKRIRVQLTDEQWQHLKRVAVERGVSVSQVVREAIDRQVAVEDLVGLRERAIRAIGGFHSGKADVSEGHDAYLSDALGR
jgi:predicted DNA-binding protein